MWEAARAPSRVWSANPRAHVYADARSGYSFEQFCNQCCSNALDPAKGRQMPVHYGDVERNWHTISSPLVRSPPLSWGNMCQPSPRPLT